MNNVNNKKEEVFSGIKSQTLITIIMGVVEVFFFSLMSRLLSQEDFGYYAIITAVTVVLQTITEAGMGSTLIQRKNPSERFINTAFTISFCIGAFSSLFLLSTAHFFSKIMTQSDSLTVAFRLMAIPLLLSNVNSIARAKLMRSLAFFKFGIFQVIAYIISNSIGAYMAVKGQGFYSIITAAILYQVFLTILLYSFSHFVPRFSFYREDAKAIVVFGGWLTGSAIVRSITEQLDKFILARWLPVSSLGAYNRPAGFISNITGKIYGIFDVVLYPILSGVQDEKDKINRSYTSSILLTTLFSFVLMAFFILGARIIIIVFFGKSWLNLTLIFQILSISIIAVSYSRIADVFFRSIGAVKQYFWNRVITCALTIVCLFIGCQYGILGAAIAFAVSKYIDMLIKIVMLKSLLDIDRFKMYKEISRTCLVPILLMVICIPLLLIKYGSLISVVLYGIGILLVFIVKPSVMGLTFVEIVYNPFIKKYKDYFRTRFSNVVKDN